MSEEDVIAVVVKNEEEVETSEETPSKRWKCSVCSKSFIQKAGLYSHVKKKHDILFVTKATISCLEEGCNFKCSMRDKLQVHLVTHHNKPLAFSKLRFNTMKDFEEWKEIFEKEEKCRFVKKSGTRIRPLTGERHSYLYCSRSGTFISSSKGKRSKTKKGSCKISNYCTASIDCIEELNGSVVAKLCSTHYGHDPSVEHLRLTKSDKAVIADKLVQGVPRDTVLDNVRASVGENVERIHFLTMKDIRNIERSFGIKSESKKPLYSCGFASVNDWVKEMECLGEECPIIFYKPKNQPKVVSEGDNCLELGDFCLVLMTKGQQEILKKFGQNGVYYLTWMNISNGYDLSLLSLMVTDDLNEAFPVAYMVCSRMTQNIEILFFKIIREKMGSFCARAIMTDDRKSLFDSWCAVMGFVPYYLLSNRFVDADWRDRLITVTNEDVQCAVYEVLYSYLSCTDPTKFDENLSQFVKHLKQNEETLAFGLYFEDNYLHRVRLWAGCYDKKSVGVNEHLNLDIIYNELLSICNNKGKFAKLLEKTLQGLLKVVRDTQYMRTSKINKQAQELNQHHSIAMKIDLDEVQSIENKKWNIKSESSNLIFTVSRKTYECNVKCPLVCSTCKMCGHMFECTCKVYNFDRTMCKHIHAVGRLFQKNINLLDNIDNGIPGSAFGEVKVDFSIGPDSTANIDARTSGKENVNIQNQLAIKISKKLKSISTVKEQATISAPKKDVENKIAVRKDIVEQKERTRELPVKKRIINVINNLQTRIKNMDEKDMDKLKHIYVKLKELKKSIDSPEDYKINIEANKDFEINIEGEKTRKGHVKKRRGRPRKLPVEKNINSRTQTHYKRGRPRKKLIVGEQEDSKVSIQRTVVVEIHEEPKPNPQNIKIENTTTSTTEVGEITTATNTDGQIAKSLEDNEKNTEITQTVRKRGRRPISKTDSTGEPEIKKVKVFKKQMKVDEIQTEVVSIGTRRSIRKAKEKFKDEIPLSERIKNTSNSKENGNGDVPNVSGTSDGTIEKGTAQDEVVNYSIKDKSETGDRDTPKDILKRSDENVATGNVQKEYETVVNETPEDNLKKEYETDSKEITTDNFKK